jgi:hypothetical protein
MNESNQQSKTEGVIASSSATCYACSEVGMTMEGTHINQLADGSWKATAKIGTIFGAEVEGELTGIGPTKALALAALSEERQNLNESLWA